MSALRAILALAVVLALQTALGHLWPAGARIVDLHLLPVVWYGIAGSQRQAMTVGCAAGLLQDAWFQAGLFGLNGFKKTLLGFALGGLGSRFDLNGGPGRFAAGFALAPLDTALELFLRNLLDRPFAVPAWWEWLAHAGATGLLAVWTFTIVNRMGRSRWFERWI